MMSSTVSDLHLSANKLVLQKYAQLDCSSKTRACYVWIDGSGQFMRCKTRTLNFEPTEPSQLPIWEYDGSSTQQSCVGESDIYLYPRCIFRDPFRPQGGKNKLVLCEALDADKKPALGNNRHTCLAETTRAQEVQPWFGFEQEYVITDTNGRPYGWPNFGFPPPQGPYYCSVGAGKSLLRDLSESLYNALLYAGVDVYGDNAEVFPSQWEYQIGTSEGIAAADHLWISRFILHRIAEDFNVAVTLDPKPVPGSWNGSGCHTNVSTIHTRASGGITHIHEAIQKLKLTHAQHLQMYDLKGGADNARRLIGTCETCDYTKFEYSVSGRSGSIRIPRTVNDNGCGYFEDRRPAANCDPYLVIAAILNTIY